VPQAKGRKTRHVRLTEPNAGSDVIGMRSTRGATATNGILNGEKMWISLGDVADHFYFSAGRTRKNKKRAITRE
jgi:glutaryl-CoA dehydrogenase (non-decarboxylating)